MNYLRNERKKSKIIFAVFGASILVAVFYYGGNSVIKWSSGKAVSMSAGLFSLQFSFSEKLGEFKSNLTLKQNLYRENEELKKTIAELSLKLGNQGVITAENSRLKEALGGNEGRKVVLAGVLAKPNRSLYDTLIVDTGSENGVKEGDLAKVSQSIIGKVVRVSVKSAKIKLFSSPGEETEVYIGEKNIPALAFGLGGGNFEIKLPKDAEIKGGDIVSSPTNGIEILGTVGSVEKKESDSFQKILAKSPINISELGWVEIVKQN